RPDFQSDGIAGRTSRTPNHCMTPMTHTRLATVNPMFQPYSRATYAVTTGANMPPRLPPVLTIAADIPQYLPPISNPATHVGASQSPMAACARKKPVTTIGVCCASVAAYNSPALASMPRIGTLILPTRYPHVATILSERTPPSGIAAIIAAETILVKYRLVSSG